MVNYVNIYRAFFDCEGISQDDKEKCMKWFYGPLHEAGYQLENALLAAKTGAEFTLAFKGFIQYRCPEYEWNVWAKLVPVCNEDPPINLYNGPPCSITVNTGTDFNGPACPTTNPFTFPDPTTWPSSPLLPSQGEDFIPVPPADDDDASSATHDSMPPLEGMCENYDIDQAMKEFYMADYADMAKMHPHHEFPPLFEHMDLDEISDIYYNQVQVLKEDYLRRYQYLVRSRPDPDYPQLDAEYELDYIINTYHQQYKRVVGEDAPRFMPWLELGKRYVEIDEPEPEHEVTVTPEQIRQMTGNDCIRGTSDLSIDEITRRFEKIMGCESTDADSMPRLIVSRFPDMIPTTPNTLTLDEFTQACTRAADTPVADTPVATTQPPVTTGAGDCLSKYGFLQFAFPNETFPPLTADMDEQYIIDTYNAQYKRMYPVVNTEFRSESPEFIGEP